MITSELERLVTSIQREKNLTRDTVISIIESAMVAAARRRYGEERDIEAQYNEDLGEIEIIYYRDVVADVEDDDVEISLNEAIEHDPDFQIGDLAELPEILREIGRRP